MSTYYIRYSMNEKEIIYQNALDMVFKGKCHYCGCTPKNDEWADCKQTLCIDCKNDDGDE